MNNKVRQSPSGKVLGALAFARVQLIDAFPYVAGVPAELPWGEITRAKGEIATITPAGRIKIARPGLYQFIAQFGADAAGATQTQFAVIVASAVPFTAMGVSNAIESVNGGGAFVTTEPDIELVTQFAFTGGGNNNVIPLVTYLMLTQLDEG